MQVPSARSSGLLGDLRQGARALFVRNFDDHMVLLRSGPIERCLVEEADVTGLTLASW
jgi:hypothetical protein